MTHDEEVKLNKYDLYFESRITKVETSIDNINQTMSRMELHLDKLDSKIDTNFKWLLGIIVGLVTIMAKGFHWY